MTIKGKRQKTEGKQEQKQSTTKPATNPYLRFDRQFDRHLATDSLTFAEGVLKSASVRPLLVYI